MCQPLAPFVYEGGAPLGAGGVNSSNSPSHGLRRASPLFKVGAKMRLRNPEQLDKLEYIMLAC